MELQGTTRYGFYELSIGEATECGCYVEEGAGGSPEFEGSMRDVKAAVKGLATTQGHRIEMYAPDDGEWSGYLISVIEPVDEALEDLMRYGTPGD